MLESHLKKTTNFELFRRLSDFCTNESQFSYTRKSLQKKFDFNNRVYHNHIIWSYFSVDSKILGRCRFLLRHHATLQRNALLLNFVKMSELFFSVCLKNFRIDLRLFLKNDVNNESKLSQAMLQYDKIFKINQNFNKTFGFSMSTMTSCLTAAILTQVCSLFFCIQVSYFSFFFMQTFQAVASSQRSFSIRIFLMSTITNVPNIFYLGYFLSSSGQTFQHENVKIMKILNEISREKISTDTKKVKCYT